MPHTALHRRALCAALLAFTMSPLTGCGDDSGVAPSDDNGGTSTNNATTSGNGSTSTNTGGTTSTNSSTTSTNNATTSTNNSTTSTNNGTTSTNNSTTTPPCDLACPPLEATCEGGAAVTYTGDGVVTEACACDYSAVREVEVCEGLCEEGVCVDAGPCDGVECVPPEEVCEGDIAVQFAGSGVCDPETGECGFDGVEQRTNCAALDQVCRDGACVDLCEGVTCDAPDDACEGDVAVRFDGDGVCDPVDGRCGFAEVETRTDCAALDQVCQGGACIDPCAEVDCSPLPSFCDDDVAVTYTGPGECLPEALMCDFGEVRVRTDCAAVDQVCQDGACVDLCAGVDCAPPDARCEGDVAVRFDGPGVCDPSAGTCGFEAVEVRDDCAALGTTCDPARGACIDPCEGATCAPPAAACDGDVAVTYTGDGVCDPVDQQCDFDAVRVRTDCAATDRVCQGGQCIDLCAGVDCAPPDNACEGDIAVRYTGPGACDPSDGQCGFDGVRTQTDCAALDRVCQGGQCVDLCANVTCTLPPSRCEVNVLVQYNGPGQACAPSSGLCDPSRVETRTDCTEGGLICYDGACRADDDPVVRPGDLVITEVMFNPSAVNDSQGEWFEVFNASTRTLELLGLTVGDGANDALPPIAESLRLPGRAYVVFGVNGDPATNGGVAVDVVYPYSALRLTNASDALILAVDGQQIDAVVYSTDTFPDTPGSAMQLGGEYEPGEVDNARAELWCSARAPIPPGEIDQGTPGARNDACTTPALITDVFTLSDEDHPQHPLENTPVIVQGLVVTALTARASNNIVWVQAPEGGPFSGIALFQNGVDLAGLAVGDVVNVTGTYSEFFGQAQIALASIAVTGRAALPAPEVLSPATLADIDLGEPWENTLVTVEGVAVVSANPDAPDDFGEFEVSGGLRVDDLLYAIEPDPVDADTFARISGPLGYSFGNFKIQPRGPEDVERP